MSSHIPTKPLSISHLLVWNDFLTFRVFHLLRLEWFLHESSAIMKYALPCVQILYNSFSLWAWHYVPTLLVFNLDDSSLIAVCRGHPKYGLAVLFDFTAFWLQLFHASPAKNVYHYVCSPERSRKDASAIKGTSIHCPNNFMTTMHLTTFSNVLL